MSPITAVGAASQANRNYNTPVKLVASASAWPVEMKPPTTTRPQAWASEPHPEGQRTVRALLLGVSGLAFGGIAGGVIGFLKSGVQRIPKGSLIGMASGLVASGAVALGFEIPDKLRENQQKRWEPKHFAHIG